MQIYNNLNNSPAFQAKLDVSKLGKKAVYWESVAKSFEERTSNYPNATLKISEDFIQYVNTKKNKEGCHAFLKKDYLNKLLNKTPLYIIVNAFVNYLKMSDRVFNTLEEAESFANTCEALDSKINDYSGKNPFNTVYNPALDLVSRYIKSEARKDDILKRWKIHP